MLGGTNNKLQHSKSVFQSLVNATKNTNVKKQQQILSKQIATYMMFMKSTNAVKSLSIENGQKRQFSQQEYRSYDSQRGSGGRGGSYQGGDRERTPSTYIRAGDFKAKKDVIKTITLEEITDLVTLTDLHQDTQDKLVSSGVKELLPVQQVTYNMFLADNEIIVKSRTGTGKTLSFLLPLEELIRRQKLESNSRNTPVQAIILEPTRELASQVQTQVDKFTNLKSVLVYGGGDKAGYQMSQISRARPDILVCTPGRLIDLLTNYNLDLSQCNYQILDEGDKMLDMGFEQDIMEIQKFLPDAARSMIFSATVPNFIQELAKKKFDNPILIDLVGNDTNQVPERIENRGILVSDQKMRANHIRHFIEENRDKKIIIFTETKQEARDFEKENYATFITLHGDLEQSQREQRLNKYRQKGQKHILVATDVASRGLDIDDIDVVIQLGCRHIDSFVHRSGRTGRIGKNGLNIIFFEKDEFKFVLNLEDELNIKINITTKLVEADVYETRQKVIDNFRSKYARQRSDVQKEVINQIKTEVFEPASDAEKEKMLNFLLSSYIGSNMHLPTQISFLSGDHKLSTYYIKLEGGTQSRQIKNAIMDYCNEHRLAFNFVNQGSDLHFLIDTDDHHEAGLSELLGDVTESSSEFKKVDSLDDIMKQIVLKKLSNGNHSHSQGGYDGGNRRSQSYDRNQRGGSFLDKGSRGGSSSGSSGRYSSYAKSSNDDSRGGQRSIRSQSDRGGDRRGGYQKKQNDEIDF
eukprot:403345090